MVVAGVEKMGGTVFSGGDLVVDSNGLAFCAVVSDVGEIDLVVIAGSITGEEDDGSVVVGVMGFNEEASAIRLLIVGGKGFGIGFSTGFVKPSFISCTFF